MWTEEGPLQPLLPEQIRTRSKSHTTRLEGAGYYSWLALQSVKTQATAFWTKLKKHLDWAKA